MGVQAAATWFVSAISARSHRANRYRDRHPHGLTNSTLPLAFKFAYGS